MIPPEVVDDVREIFNRNFNFEIRNVIINSVILRHTLKDREMAD